MNVEYRVVGSSQIGMFGPTKNEKTARSCLAHRKATYGDAHPWGPWRLETRTISDWENPEKPVQQGLFG